MQDFLKAYLSGTSAGNTLSQLLPGNCSTSDILEGGSSSSSVSSSGGGITAAPLLSASSLRVICTETFPVQETAVQTLEDTLYCGYYQVWEILTCWYDLHAVQRTWAIQRYVAACMHVRLAGFWKLIG